MDAGATVNQVVLAWLIGAEVPMIRWSVPPRERNWTRAWTRWTWELTAEQRARLDAAR